MGITGNIKTKEISQYLPFYLGCKVVYNEKEYYLEGLQKHGLDYGGKWVFIMIDADDSHWVSVDDIKLQLRFINSVTAAEWAAYHKIVYGIPVLTKKDNAEYFIRLSAEQINYLRSIYVDVDGLIDAGLALNKTKIQKNG